MIITNDNKDNQTLRMSRFEQSRLAAINILSIEIQNLRSQGVDDEALKDKNAELATMRRKFKEMISNE